MKIPIFFLLLFLIALCGACEKDDAGSKDTKDPKNGLIANPDLNQKLYTTVKEKIYTLDPANGNSSEFASLNEYNAIEDILEYNNGILYAVSENNGLWAFDINTSELLWTIGLPKYGTDLPKTNPVYHNGNIYVAGGHGIMMAFDASTGQEVWRFDMKEENDYYRNMYGRPTLYGDYLVYGTSNITDDNYLYCLHNQTGAFIWKKLLVGEGITGDAVAVDNDVIYVPGEDFEALELSTGKLIWSFPLRDDPGAGTPVISGEKVLFVGAREDDNFSTYLYCLSKSDGQEIWHVDAGYDRPKLNAPKVDGNFVFCTQEEPADYWFKTGYLYAVSLETGEEIWKNENVYVSTFFTYANGRLFFSGDKVGEDDDKGIMCMDASTGELLWHNPDVNFALRKYVAPIVIAANGVFKP